MIYFKTAEEIELLRENNRLVSATLAELAKEFSMEPAVFCGFTIPVTKSSRRSNPSPKPE